MTGLVDDQRIAVRRCSSYDPALPGATTESLTLANGARASPLGIGSPPGSVIELAKEVPLNRQACSQASGPSS